MEIRIILDPNEVREILEKTGEVVITPTAANVTVDARADRRGRPLANPPPVQVGDHADEASEAPKAAVRSKPATGPAKTAAAAPAKAKAAAKPAASQAEIQTALAQYAKKHGRDAARAILDNYGKTVADVKVEDYGDLLKDLQPEVEEADGW